jgi:hypothetical protein
VCSRRRHARGRVMLDGLELRLLDDTALSGAELDRLLRILARLLIHPHRADGDHEAIAGESQPSSALTVPICPRPDHDDTNEAA